MNRLGAVGAVLVLSAFRLTGQSPDDRSGPTFEVASVRQNTSGATGGSYDMRPGSQLVITNYTLRDIIQNSYGLRSYQLLGRPDWIDRERFDIVARPPEGVPRDARMMHALLADRFKLRFHRETRQLPIYELVLARADRRLGAQLRPTGVDCVAVRAARARGETISPPPSAAGGPFCSASAVPGRLRASGYTLADVARNLSNSAGRLVVDRTGLTGSYDVDLSWMPENAPPASAVDSNAPGLFTAVEEQLGLKLAPATGPIEVLVIDSVERPSPD